MKITQSYNFYTFKARNKTIRKADDIQRESRKTFPMASPSYMKETYSIFNKENPILDNVIKRKHIDDKITKIREVANFPFLYGIKPIIDKELINHYLLTLYGVDKYKTGNCAEHAITTLSTLASKGYTNGNLGSISANIKFVNKNTGETEFEVKKPIDHTFVTTNLQTSKNGKENPKLVIDSWMGFADSISGATARYKSFYSEAINDFETEALMEFKLQAIDNGKCVKKSDYDIRTTILIDDETKHNEEEMDALGYYTRIMTDCFEEQ